MKKVKFNIDKTNEAYTHIEGESVQELEKFIYYKNIFEDCCGTITYEDENKKLVLSVAAVKEYGVYLSITDNNKIYLSLSDKSKLSDTVDVWGDDLLVSEGLFINTGLAWKGICEFMDEGTVCKDITWLAPSELPPEGNYI